VVSLHQVDVRCESRNLIIGSFEGCGVETWVCVVVIVGVGVSVVVQADVQSRWSG